jgi:hypothetical protein
MRRKSDLDPAFFDRDFFPCHNAPQFGLTTSGWKLRKRKGGADWRRTMPDVAHDCRCQIPVVVTSLDPECDFHKECKTVFVNAHGCGIIVPQLLNNQTPVTVELVSNGANKNGRVVLAIPLLENFSWFLGVEFDSPANFWEVEHPPADWHT